MDYGACYGRGGAGSFPPARLLFRYVDVLDWLGWLGWAGWVVGNTLFVLHSTRTVLGCEHKSVEHCPKCRNYYVCNRFFFFFSAATGPIYANFW